MFYAYSDIRHASTSTTKQIQTMNIANFSQSNSLKDPASKENACSSGKKCPSMNQEV
jgi:hypothetical protein